VDPRFMGFRSLRVINEDRVEPGAGFPTHSHRDMEIITYLLEGELEHKDSMGTGSIIRPGEAQKMSAGKGVTHSEYNASKKTEVHLLQIWILPETKGIQPNYDQRVIDPGKKKNSLVLVASGKNRDVIKVYQDMELFVSVLEKGKRLDYALAKGRFAWLQVERGQIRLNKTAALKAGDGAAIEKENNLEIEAQENSEILLFDLA
jgi:redox-sensitive bicupin YhaK (pirin superfamily)